MVIHAYSDDYLTSAQRILGDMSVSYTHLTLPTTPEV